MNEEPINSQKSAELPKQKPTEYVILEVHTGSDSDGGTSTFFTVVDGIKTGADRGPATFPGVTKQAAIKLADPGPGTYIAVPARSFDPIKLEVEERPQTKMVAGTL